jgi:hypothetical protein
LSKITDLMRRAVIISGVAGALIIGATATSNASVPAAQAPAAASSTGMSSAVQAEDPPTTMAYGDCVFTLEVLGYEATNTRRFICAAASLFYPGQATRLATCTAAMWRTGVSLRISGVACLAAVS